MLSRKIAVVTGLFAIWVGIKVFMDQDESWAWGVIPVGIAVAVLWQLSDPINDWYLSKFPQDLDEHGKQLVETHLPYVHRLQPNQKERFYHRIDRFATAREWVGMNVEDIPDDIKVLITAPAVLLSLHHEKFMYSHYERIILYKGPFVSPNYNKHFHNVEAEHEDGTILLNVEAVTQGVFERGKIYDVALHAWIDVYLNVYHKNTPKLLFLDWSQLERISKMSKMLIEHHTGLPDLDTTHITLHHYIVFPESFKNEFPQIFDSINALFKLYHDV